MMKMPQYRWQPCSVLRVAGGECPRIKMSFCASTNRRHVQSLAARRYLSVNGQRDMVFREAMRKWHVAGVGIKRSGGVHVLSARQ